MKLRDPKDEALDRLLSHIASVDPDAGFNARVFRIINARAAAKPARAVFWASAFAVLSAAAIAFAVGFQLVRPVPAKGRNANLRVSSFAPVISRSPQRYRAHYSASQRIRRPYLQRTPLLLSAVPDPTQVASFPAAPDPLTDQEKLLLQLAHVQDPDQLAVLIPEKRAAEQAAEEDAYLKFFPPPPPLPPPTEVPQQP